MKAASHMPSGVFTITSFSTTGIAAADAEPAAATMPAATDMAMKSRRDTSAVSFIFSESRLSSVIAFLLLRDGCVQNSGFPHYLFAKPYASRALVSSVRHGGAGQALGG